MAFMDEVAVLKNLGCEDLKLCSIAARVYLDLKDVQGLTNIEKCYNEALKIIYFRCGNEGTDVYLPYSSCVDILFDEIGTIQKTICRNGKDSLFLSLCDPSSAILYFHLAEGCTIS